MITWSDLQILYAFHAPSHFVLEVKRLDLPEGSPPGQKFHWLYLNEDQQKIQKLKFKASHSHPVYEQRDFENAWLRFDQLQAELNVAGELPLTLAKTPPFELPDEVRLKILSYLNLNFT